jgi:hypothetical protein
MKSNPTTGEELYWVEQNGPSDLKSTMQKYLNINKPAENFHLFGYRI